MEAGISLLEQYGLVPYHDSIPQISNYAVLLMDMGERIIVLGSHVLNGVWLLFLCKNRIKQ